MARTIAVPTVTDLDCSNARNTNGNVSPSADISVWVAISSNCTSLHGNRPIARAAAARMVAGDFEPV